MDYADLFDRQGRAMDDLLLHAFRVPQDRFAGPGPEGAPSLRDLLADWLETQRRAVHAALQGRPYHPLPSSATANVMDLSRAFGGFRMTLRDAVEATFKEDLTRKVPWTAPDGSTSEVTADEVLAHLLLHGARMLGLVAERLRQLGEPPPKVDLLP
jgi:uncharacterized damage-inducible protein DinB